MCPGLEISSALKYAAEVHLQVQKCLHVLDDFLLIASSYDKCQQDLDNFLSMCSIAGVPIAADKTFGPTQVLEFLGITINIPDQCTTLPLDKVSRCLTLFDLAISHPKCTLHQLQQLLGHLNFACKAIIPGRPFLTSLYAATKKVKKPHHKVRLTQMVKEDLWIWKTFLNEFNGRSFFLDPCADSDPSLQLYTDASSTIGYGACFGHEWVCGQWTDLWKSCDILVLEMYAVLLAVVLWGSSLANKSILLHVDNNALVHIVNRGHTSCQQVIPLLRILYVFALKYNIQFTARHIPGVKNVSADALSRLQMDVFRKSLPHAAFLPRRIPDWINVIRFNPWRDSITSYL